MLAAELARRFEIGAHPLDLPRRGAGRGRRCGGWASPRPRARRWRGFCSSRRAAGPAPAILYIHAHGGRYDIGAREVLDGRRGAGRADGAGAGAGGVPGAGARHALLRRAGGDAGGGGGEGGAVVRAVAGRADAGGARLGARLAGGGSGDRSRRGSGSSGSRWGRRSATGWGRWSRGWRRWRISAASRTSRRWWRAGRMTGTGTT